MKIFVTGGAGFIGSNLVDELIRQGHKVTIFDNFSTGKKENIHEDASWYYLPIMDERLEDLFMTEKPEVLIHLAAQIDVGHSLVHPLEDAKTNILGTIRLLEYCKKYNVRKVIFASSAAVYGKPRQSLIQETHPTEPLSCYGLSKLSGEGYIQLYSRLYGLNYTIFRFANVYGFRQEAGTEGGVVSIFLDKLLQNQIPVIYGDGQQTRDFIFVKDVVSANIAALTRGDGRIFNISTGVKNSIGDLLRTMCHLLDRPFNPNYEAKRSGDIQDSGLDNREAMATLNWQPQYSLEQGLKSLIGIDSK